MKGDPIEFDDNLHAFHAVKDLALRKPGTYIDGIPARAMTQVSVSKDAHHVMVSWSLPPAVPAKLPDTSRSRMTVHRAHQILFWFCAL